MVYHFNTSTTGLAKRGFDYMRQKCFFFIIQLSTVSVPWLTLIFIIELRRSEQSRQCLIRASFHTCPPCSFPL